MNKSIYYFMVLMFMSLSFDLVAQTSVDIPASKDNTLYESTSGAQSNGMGDHFFAGTTNQNENNIRRGLIAFDIAANVPAGATIESVVLKLNMSKTNALAVEQNIALHTVLQNWGEGASEASGEEGSGASAATDDATWTYTFYDTASWNTPGGSMIPRPPRPWMWIKPESIRGHRSKWSLTCKPGWTNRITISAGF